MFAVTVELLTGRYVATQFNDRSKTEWPPHPARLFSAAVAAWADHGDNDPVERAALEWWETLDPPTIGCSLGELELTERALVTHFVPVNDTSVVNRDTARTYDALLTAEATAADPTLDDKAKAKAFAKLDKARAKAVEDSRKATEGIAPNDRDEILPTKRGKQARLFPTIVPADPVVTYYWQPNGDEDPAAIAGHLAGLDDLFARIGRIGHSSTPVSVTVSADADPDDANVALEPGPGRRVIGLRVPTDGQLDNLIRAYEGSRQGTEPRTMPARIASYRRPTTRTDPPASSIGEDWIVLAPTGDSRLMVRDVPAVARTLRSALMSVAGRDGATIPEVISGHRPRTEPGEGPTEPSERPHLMVLGLPFAGHTKATGEVLGVAVVLPHASPASGIDLDDWAILRSTVDGFLLAGGKLTFKGGGRPVHLQPAELTNLNASSTVQRWVRPSRTWVSVTPVALSRNPGQLGHRDPAKREAAHEKATASIAAACEQIGLPRPTSVEISLDPFIRGTRPVHTFPPARTGKLTRVQVHAKVSFDQAVAGPIVLGAGRYQGLGLFLPIGSASTIEAAS